MKPILSSGLLLVALTAAIPSAHAASLVLYNFETSGGGAFANKAPAGVAATIAVGTRLDTDDGISTTSSPVGGGSQSFFARGTSLYTGTADVAAGFGNAQTNGGYLTITVTANPGTTFSLTSFTFSQSRTVDTAPLRILVTSATNDTYAGRLALPGFDYGNVNVVDGDQTTSTEMSLAAGTNVSWGAKSLVSVDVSGAEFQNATSATFRIYGFQTDLANASQILRLDNIAIDGTVIPETSATILGLLGLTTLLVKRRR